MAVLKDLFLADEKTFSQGLNLITSPGGDMNPCIAGGAPVRKVVHEVSDKVGCIISIFEKTDFFLNAFKDESISASE